MSSDYGTPIDFMDSIPGSAEHQHAIAYAQETPPGRPPVQYLIGEQARSLQELQHEVRALLEFRELVIDTFPNLRAKLAPAKDGAAASPAAAWLPGVRVRRRKESATGSSAKRVSDAVQDSGFSTETSCKDTHSTGSSNVPRANSPGVDETEDELCNLLDVILRKGTTLKDELAAIQGGLENRDADFADALALASPSQLRELRQERDRLLERLAGARAAAETDRLRAERAEHELRLLETSKRDLEWQVGELVTQRGEVNARIHDLHFQFVARGSENCDKTDVCDSKRLAEAASPTRAEQLDALLLAAGKLPKTRAIDSKKFAAILSEFDPLMLQKHLLSSTVQNDILMEQIESATKLEVVLINELDKVREDNRTLKFQLEDKDIELQGTRARIRVLEQIQNSSNQSCNSPDVIPNLNSTADASTELTSMQQLTPLIKNGKARMQLQDGSSSTESAQDNAESKSNEEAIGKRRPSKIPLKSTPPKTPGKTTPVPSTPRGRDSPAGRPQSANSWKHRSHSKSIDSLKSNSSSMVTSKDSLSSKLRYSESLSKLSPSMAGQIGRNGTLRKGSLTNQRPAAQQTNEKNISKRDWAPNKTVDPPQFPDSLDTEISSTKSSKDNLEIHSYQTAENYLWNMREKSREFYDSINSGGFSIYRNGEEMADCDSLEKHEAFNYSDK